MVSPLDVWNFFLIILTPSTLLLCLWALISLDLYPIFLLIGEHVTFIITSYYLFRPCLCLFPLDGWNLGCSSFFCRGSIPLLCYYRSYTSH